VPAVPPRARPTATRRTALALGAAGLVAVAGCDGDDEPTPDGRSPAADPDGALVDRVLAELAGITALVAQVGRRHAKLRAPMADLRRLHEAHTKALDGSPATDPGAARVPSRPAEALALVRRRELGLQRRLVDAAVSAESGTLARLLASMSAAVSQRLAAMTGGSS